MPSSSCLAPPVPLHHAPECDRLSGTKVGTTRGLVSSPLLAFSLSEISINVVLVIVRTLAACRASLLVRDRVGVVTQEVPCDCDRIPVASETHQKLTTGCSWLPAACRGTLSTRTPSVGWTSTAQHGVQLCPVVTSLFQQTPPLQCLAVRTNS